MITTATKTRQVIHLKKNDRVIFRNQTSGQETVVKVHSVTLDEEYRLPVRVTYAVPEANDKKATTVIGYAWAENVEVES